MLSFNIEEFLMVLERYNLSIWPLQIIAWLLGIVALFFLIRKTKYSSQIILGVLALYWFWNGIVFCPIFWAPTYKYAYLFAAFCIIQGFLFMTGIFRPNISFGAGKNLFSVTGILFVVYAMAGYQLVGYFKGHIYPSFFPFGLVPCPTTIFTFGILLMTDKKLPKYYLFIPLVTSIMGVLAVYKGVLEDIGLIVAGIAGTFMIILRDRNPGYATK